MTSINEEFPATRSLMYCAEQIVIPQKFPNILKTYAKAAIRTQPYDLLRWSAAYFRCLATNVPPPVKIRLERKSQFGDLTRGLLRVLLEQMGKGFFVDRNVLQNRWEHLSLPEEELLRYLSLCRMLHWSQVHWLKLFAVMVASLNTCFLDTIIMLCELLTEGADGGPCPIPMWMAREVYTYLAEMDCSVEQRFIGGRKIIGPDDELEEAYAMPDLPQLMNLESFRNAILERFNDRLGIDHVSGPKDFPYRLDPPRTDDDLADTVSNTSEASRPSHVSSSFKFIGDYADPAEVIRRTPDFDSVILLLHEVNGSKLHEYQGPHKISDKTHRHVSRRALERIHRMDNQNATTFQMSADITQQEHDQLLKEIEPPWSWIHQFAAQNCRDKSHNFLEMQSIASDETPPESSDESFDFENNRFHDVDDDEMSETTENRTVIEDILLKEEVETDNRVTMHSVHDIVNASGLINDIIDIVQLAVANKEIDKLDAESIRSFISDEQNLPGLDIRALQMAIKKAHETKVVFKNFAELEAFLRKEMILPESEPKLCASVETNSAVLEIKPSVTNISQIIDSRLMQSNVEQPQHDVRSNVTSLVAPTPPKALESQFDDCQIEIDEKITNKATPDNMILGLIDTPPGTPIVIPTPPQTPTPTPSSPYNTSSGIISENVSLHEFPPPLEPLAFLPPPPKPEKKPFQCSVPPMPGIGPAVTKETIQNVLTYLKGRSRNDNGLVYPRHFHEAKCPNIVETYDG